MSPQPSFIAAIYLLDWYLRFAIDAEIGKLKFEIDGVQLLLNCSLDLPKLLYILKSTKTSNNQLCLIVHFEAALQANYNRDGR